MIWSGDCICINLGLDLNFSHIQNKCHTHFTWNQDFSYKDNQNPFPNLDRNACIFTGFGISHLVTVVISHSFSTIALYPIIWTVCSVVKQFTSKTRWHWKQTPQLCHFLHKKFSSNQQWNTCLWFTSVILSKQPYPLSLNHCCNFLSWEILQNTTSPYFFSTFISKFQRRGQLMPNNYQPLSFIIRNLHCKAVWLWG